jgi:hypothetical protein
MLPAGPTEATTDAGEDVDGEPHGELLAGPVAATIEAEEDIDGGPLGSAAGKSNSGHHRR